MFPFIATLFLVVPIVEIYLLIQVGQVIGAGWTILLVVLTAVIGVALLKQQGLSTLRRAQQKLNHDELPARVDVDQLTEHAARHVLVLVDIADPELVAVGAAREGRLVLADEGIRIPGARTPDEGLRDNLAFVDGAVIAVHLAEASVVAKRRIEPAARHRGTRRIHREAGIALAPQGLPELPAHQFR